MSAPAVRSLPACIGALAAKNNKVAAMLLTLALLCVSSVGILPVRPTFLSGVAVAVAVLDQLQP